MKDTMPDKIKYAQIGVGHAHASKIEVYRESDEYAVVGVVEPDDKLRAAASKQAAYRDLPWLSLEQALSDSSIAVVGVETRVEELLRHGQLALDAGKHIHLDKPAGASLPEFRKLLDTAMSKHLAVQLGYMYRYNPAIVLLRQLLKAGTLGEPFELHAVMSKKIGDGARGPLAAFAGGAMFELGCHLVDLVVGLLGAPEKVHPFLRASRAKEDATTAPGRAKTPADLLRDNTLAVFEYPGATATVRTTLIEVDGFARRHLALCGSEGTMHIQPLDRPQAKLTLARTVGKHHRGEQAIDFTGYRRYVEDAKELAAVVRHERDPLFGYHHDLAVQTALLQACDMPTA